MDHDSATEGLRMMNDDWHIIINYLKQEFDTDPVIVKFRSLPPGFVMNYLGKVHLTL